MSIGDPKVESAKHVMHEAVDVNQGRLKSCDFDYLLTLQISLIFAVLPALEEILSTVRTM